MWPVARGAPGSPRVPHSCRRGKCRSKFKYGYLAVLGGDVYAGSDVDAGQPSLEIAAEYERCTFVALRTSGTVCKSECERKNAGSTLRLRGKYHVKYTAVMN